MAVMFSLQIWIDIEVARPGVQYCDQKCDSFYFHLSPSMVLYVCSNCDISFFDHNENLVLSISVAQQFTVV